MIRDPQSIRDTKDPRSAENPRSATTLIKSCQIRKIGFHIDGSQSKGHIRDLQNFTGETKN